MPGHDLPSVVALGGALQSLAGRFDAARDPQLMHSEPACPAALRPDATALVDAVGSLRPVLDAGGRALTSWTYAVARLDREQAAIEADAAHYGFVIEHGRIAPSSRSSPTTCPSWSIPSPAPSSARASTSTSSSTRSSS
jgi:hypothetical protein